MHYYKFNISNWYLNTNHLSLEEEAVYFRLINFYYDSEQPIPVETQSVIRRLRLGSYSDIVGLVLSEFFVLQEDGWHHKTCDELLAEYHSNAEKNRKNGKGGGRPSKNKVVEDNPQITQSVSTDNPMVTLTKNYKLRTNIQTPNGVDDSIFKEYLSIRKKAKKSWSTRVENRLTNEGAKLGWNLQKVIEYCLEKEWVNFEAEWVKDKPKSSTSSSSIDIFAPVRLS
jgi:uncharacterized protein YdaU (DUF1376 family)